MNHLNLESLDTDGAVRDAAEAVGLDRNAFLRKSALAGGGLVAGGAFFSLLGPAEAAISSHKSKRNDVKILNYALTLEFLESEFYSLAVANKAYGASPQLQRFAEVVAEHEAKHVSFLKGALGSAAVKKPTFDFGAAVTDPAMYTATAQVLEDTGVSAYLGQAAHIQQGPILTAAATILAIEARHASWIRFLNAPAVADTPAPALPAPSTFDKPASERSILSKAGGFIK